MEVLGRLDGGEATGQALGPLVEQYRGWIGARRREVEGGSLQGVRRETAEQLLDYAPVLGRPSGPCCETKLMERNLGSNCVTDAWIATVVLHQPEFLATFDRDFHQLLPAHALIRGTTHVSAERRRLYGFPFFSGQARRVSSSLRVAVASVCSTCAVRQLLCWTVLQRGLRLDRHANQHPTPEEAEPEHPPRQPGHAISRILHEKLADTRPVNDHQHKQAGYSCGRNHHARQWSRLSMPLVVA